MAGESYFQQQVGTIGGNCRPFARPNGLELLNSTARALIGPVDVARDAVVRLGFRPYEVHLIRTRWSGGYRGAGQESVISDDVLLPIPLVTSLDGLQEIVTPGGVNEQGTVRVSEISGRYTEQFLMGLDKEGNAVAADTQFYWEILFPELGQVQDRGDRRRMQLVGAPSYDASNVEWSVQLTRSWGDRQSDGRPTP